MTSLRLGVIGGLIFGILVIWQGLAAAALVLLFVLVGALAGVGIRLWWGIQNGDVDTEDIKKLLGAIFSDKSGEGKGR